ncbi:MAG: hypothetical protein AAF942_05915 [Pseudomonadota bacterium]
MKYAKRLLAGIVLVAAIAFLGLALYRSWSGFTALLVEPGTLIAVVLLAVFYGVAFQLLFLSWFATLRARSPIRVSTRAAASVYNISNIAKYLPGNIFHLAGRQVLGTRVGWSHAALAQATILEISAIVAAIAMLLLAVAAVAPDAVLSVVPWEGSLSAATELRRAAVLCLAIAGLIFLALARKGAYERLFGVAAKTVALAVALCAAFFLVNIVIAAIFADQLTSAVDTPSALAVGMAYIAAWLAGFAVPGAPGGLGVRESVLVLLLTANGSDLAAFALGLGIGMRLISVLGDAIAAGTAVVAERLRPAPNAVAEAGGTPHG